MPQCYYSHLFESAPPKGTNRLVGMHRRHGAYVRGPCIPCPTCIVSQRGGRAAASWAATGAGGGSQFGRVGGNPLVLVFQVSALQRASTIDSLRRPFHARRLARLRRSSVSRNAEGEHPLALRSSPSAYDYTSNLSRPLLL